MEKTEDTEEAQTSQLQSGGDSSSQETNLEENESPELIASVVENIETLL